ncbi:ATP-binding protein [Arthrobacter sp. 260]|uniref:ATP-binding protein n=1 Tax=Arthrobacter sp. 260 TaxID=2735314 RepID=UPI001E37043F|nr:ATP-binding protein [Arthrobacter sp. 260]
MRPHTGVYFPFLAEAPEYQRGVLEALREPLESGELILHRSAGTASYPARFQLVMALNPCPCGLASGKGIDCVCTAEQRRRYFNRLSQPLLDRVDLQLAVSRVSLADYADASTAESSKTVAARVAAARAAQRERLAKWGASTNAGMSSAVLNDGLKLARAVTAPVDRAMQHETLTMRGHDRVLRVAWTLADLGGRTSPSSDDVEVALTLRLQESSP